jgi:hypothetical protein
MPLNAQQLGELIFKENPYTPEYASTGNVARRMQPADAETEKQADVGHWYFKGVPRTVELALRIPYTYVDDAGVTIKDYLLIGYEGGGAY